MVAVNLPSTATTCVHDVFHGRIWRFDNTENVQQSIFGTNDYESPGRKIGVFRYGDALVTVTPETVPVRTRPNYITAALRVCFKFRTSDTPHRRSRRRHKLEVAEATTC